MKNKYPICISNAHLYSTDITFDDKIAKHRVLDKWSFRSELKFRSAFSLMKSRSGSAYFLVSEFEYKIYLPLCWKPFICEKINLFTHVSKIQLLKRPFCVHINHMEQELSRLQTAYCKRRESRVDVYSKWIANNNSITWMKIGAWSSQGPNSKPKSRRRQDTENRDYVCALK